MQMQCFNFFRAPISRGVVFSMKNNEKWDVFSGDDIMNLAVETMFGPESKLCVCGLEVRRQELRKRVGGEDVEDGEKEFFEAIVRDEDLRLQIQGILHVIDTH